VRQFDADPQAGVSILPGYGEATTSTGLQRFAWCIRTGYGAGIRWTQPCRRPN